MKEDRRAGVRLLGCRLATANKRPNKLPVMCSSPPVTELRGRKLTQRDTHHSHTPPQLICAYFCHDVGVTSIREDIRFLNLHGTGTH